jgi:hypothetical protein
MSDEPMTVNDVLEAQKEDVTPEYLVIMYEEDATWEFPGSGGKYFITAKHPGLAQDKIRSAMAPGGSVRQTKQGTESSLTLATQTEAGFVEKCVWQITDYRFLARVKDESGRISVEERAYRTGSAGNGDTKHNRESYTAWLRTPFRDEIEAFLDRLGARSAGVEEDLADLGEGLG